MKTDYNRLLRIQETIFDITVNCYQPLIVKYKDSRTVCQTVLEWANEFECWWESLSEDEQDRRDYILSIDAFCERHLRAKLTPDEPDEYVVRVIRTEKYEATVRVTATSKYEAEEKVKHALEEENTFSYIIDDMTENINVESQDYEATPLMPGDKFDFQIYNRVEGPEASPCAGLDLRHGEYDGDQEMLY